jgi:hypothetical protein
MCFMDWKDPNVVVCAETGLFVIIGFGGWQVQLPRSDAECLCLRTAGECLVLLLHVSRVLQTAAKSAAVAVKVGCYHCKPMTACCSDCFSLSRAASLCSFDCQYGHWKRERLLHDP